MRSSHIALKISSLLACLTVLIASAGCSHNAVQPPTPADTARSDNAYMDLQPGWRLRIIVPLLKSGGFRVSDPSPAVNGGTLSVSSEDFIGYRVFQYAIAGRKDGLVHLEFISASVTRNGTTAVELHPPALPFSLPMHREHIRLAYLVRVSEADHNMAILASRHVEALNQFTREFQKNPGDCAAGAPVSCAWVPAGIAVRPEKVESVR